MQIFEARSRLESAVLRAILAQHYSRDENPYADAAAEHADETEALAARDLVRAIEELPADRRPVGWNEEPSNG